MKICFYTENHLKGGLDTFLINIFNSWPDANDEITLICNESHPGLIEIKEKTYRQIQIKTYRRISSKIQQELQDSVNRSFRFFFLSFVNFVIKLLRYPVLFPWYLFSLRSFFKKSDFERLIVVNGGYPASLLCRSAVISWGCASKEQKAILNFHNSASPPSLHTRMLEHFIDKLVFKFSKNIVSVSQNCLNSLKVRRAFNDFTKMSYIYNGIECPLKGASNFKKNSNRDKYCLMLGTYEKRKGHSFIIDVFNDLFKEFNEIKLLIHGYGLPSQKLPIQQKIEKLNLGKKIILGDFVAETTELISNSELIVMPSQEYESFGLTLIEAMAHGVPIVATDVGGMPEVMGQTKAGFVCAKDNVIEFSNAIKKILKNPDLSEKLGKNGRMAFNKKFHASQMTNQYHKLIKEPH